jgi:glycosyltransferase involved in cell wall biosynthesis
VTAHRPITGDRPAERVLLIAGFWPTPDRPSAGIFVARRAAGQSMTVVAPRSYRGSMALRYLGLLVRAVTVRGPFGGVEAHPLFPTGLIGLLAARIRRVPLVVYAHGSDVRDTAARSVVHRRLARLVVRGATEVVTNSRATAVLVEDLGGTATVIPPGVDDRLFHPTARPRRGRVLYLGGTDRGKGYDVALPLADTLLGPGLRTLSTSEVAVAMAEHDVVLVPSRAEAFGLVAAEAIASGRWVVARKVGGLAEVIVDGVTGTLVETDAAFAAAIAAVPDYDPDEIAAHATALTNDESNLAMALVWTRIQGRAVAPSAPDRPADPSSDA